MRRAHRTLAVAAAATLLATSVAWTNLSGAQQAGQAPRVSANAAELHKEAIVVDGHVHITELEYHQGIDAWKEQETGLFDYARAKQGGLDVVVHAVYPIDAYNLYNYGVKHALRLIEQFYRTLEANQDKMELALTSADVRRIVGSGKMAAILAIEGNPDVEGDLDVLRMWHRLGVRMLQLTAHNGTNALIDAEIDEHVWGGVSEKGRAFIREMNRLGIIVDPSHSTEAAHLQAVEASLAPIADSHATYRRRPDEPGLALPSSAHVIKATAAKGGLYAMIHHAVDSKPLEEWRRRNPRSPLSWRDPSGEFISFGRATTLAMPNKGIRPPEDRRGEYITALDAEVRDQKVRRTLKDRHGDQYGVPWRQLQAQDIEAGVPLASAADWASQAQAVVDLVGDDHVGIGLDLMARPIMRDFTAASYPLLTQAMLEKGMSPGSVRKVLGENWLRVLDQAKVPGLQPSTESRTHKITNTPRETTRRTMQ